ncbi:MAG: XRE family transcriptional regulator [Pseudomonadota bacterium]
MPFDVSLFGGKVRGYREQFKMDLAGLARRSGIPARELDNLENGLRQPTGDEVLILADCFLLSDFRFLISDETTAPYKQTRELFRTFDSELGQQDRWAIQEFLYLCECEEELEQLTGTVRRRARPFQFKPRGTFHKGHGEQGARALRQHLDLDAQVVSTDIFAYIRRLGIHCFRRRLQNSAISGMFIRHPTAGKCILVNYQEDVYRQRFTAGHELAHAIFDAERDFVVSFHDEKKWCRDRLVEIRANTFSSRFLMPPESLVLLPRTRWDEHQVHHWCHQFRVNRTTLLIALKEADLITSTEFDALRTSVRAVPQVEKPDPELGGGLSPAERTRKAELIERGLTHGYVSLALDAHDQGQISLGRLAEVLRIPERELTDLASLYGRKIQ